MVTWHASGRPGGQDVPSDADQPRALVVDGDDQVRAHLRTLLEAEGLRVTEAPDGPEALDIFSSTGADLVLLELAFPGMSGFELCRALRRQSRVAIIVVTALREEVDKVLALEIGADDYVTKPFLDRELALRTRAVLRRTQRPAGTLPACAGGTPSVMVQLDARLQCVTVGDRQVPLSPREFRLLELFVRNGGRLMTRQQILSAIWGADARQDGKTLEAQVRRLRGKIEVDPHRPTLILTVRGRGYRLAI